MAKRAVTKKWAIFSGLIALTAVFAFQNCGSGFEIASLESASTDDTALSGVPAEELNSASTPRSFLQLAPTTSTTGIAQRVVFVPMSRGSATTNRLIFDEWTLQGAGKTYLACNSYSDSTKCNNDANFTLVESIDGPDANGIEKVNSQVPGAANGTVSQYITYMPANDLFRRKEQSPAIGNLIFDKERVNVFIFSDKSKATFTWTPSLLDTTATEPSTSATFNPAKSGFWTGGNNETAVYNSSVYMLYCNYNVIDNQVFPAFDQKGCTFIGFRKGFRDIDPTGMTAEFMCYPGHPNYNLPAGTEIKVGCQHGTSAPIQLTTLTIKAFAQPTPQPTPSPTASTVSIVGSKRTFTLGETFSASWQAGTGYVSMGQRNKIYSASNTLIANNSTIVDWGKAEGSTVVPTADLASLFVGTNSIRIDYEIMQKSASGMWSTVNTISITVVKPAPTPTHSHSHTDPTADSVANTGC